MLFLDMETFWGVCLKARELGAKVVSISGRDGYVYDPEGILLMKKLISYVKFVNQMMLN